MAVIDVISANLPILRELSDRMGQLELGERVGVSRRTIARLENAEVNDPGVELIGRIADELGVSLMLVTETPVRAVTIALPEDVADQLDSEDSAAVLDAMVRAARREAS